MDRDGKKSVLSAMQPTNALTLGNYLGALRSFIAMQDDYHCFFCVADLHAITVQQNSVELRSRSQELVALYMACGLDPNRSTLFVQSHVPEHAQLNWVLACSTYMGELQRMTQYKEKSTRHAENINAGLFTYPVLMAADILLYQAHYVPVGADQKQHVELARDIAGRFNKTFGEVFVVPEPYIPKVGARIMSLQDPEKKMSKSDTNENAYIRIIDEPDVIARKIKRAITDCEGVISTNPEKAGVYNLLSIYSVCENISLQEAADTFSGKGYGEFKTRVADAVISLLTPIQIEYKHLLGDRRYLSENIILGAQKAHNVTQKTIRKVYHKLGLDS